MEFIDTVIEKIKKNAERNNVDVEMINRWAKVLDDDTLLLMVSLMSVKNYASEEGVKKIGEFNKRYPYLQLNLNGITKQMNAFTYYYRFEKLIDDLLKEYILKTEEEKQEIIKYYIFNNSLRELTGYGASYYYDFKAKSKNGTLFRITNNDEKDSQLFQDIKWSKNKEADALVSIFGIEEPKNGDEHYQEKLNYYNYMRELLSNNNRNSVSKQLIALAVNQVNGCNSSVPSYSKSLGIDLFKYAHDECKLIIKKNADINCIKVRDCHEIYSFQKFIGLEKGKRLEDIESFSIDFSEVRDEKMENLNNWLNNFLGDKRICTYGNPIADRHVVNTFPAVKEERIDLSKAELLTLMRAYQNGLIRHRSSLKEKLNSMVEQVTSNVVQDMEIIFSEIQNQINKTNNKNSEALNFEIEYLKTNINKVEIDKIRKILYSVNWDDEDIYFQKFFAKKDDLEFFKGTEKSGIMTLIKYIFYNFEENVSNGATVAKEQLIKSDESHVNE